MRPLLLALVVLVACSSAPAPTRCTPGASVACVCPGVGTGAQVCAADGASYGACACGVDGGADAAGDVPPTEDRPAAMDAAQCQRGMTEQCTCGSGALGMRVCEAWGQWPGCRCSAGDAAVVVPTNRGSRGQACRIIGDACSDGSLCMNAVSYQHTDSPRGVCTSPCRDAASTSCRPTGAGAEEVCLFLRPEVTPHCLQRCSSAVPCPTSTRCSGQTPGPGMAPISVCIPEADP